MVEPLFVSFWYLLWFIALLFIRRALSLDWGLDSKTKHLLSPRNIVLAFFDVVLVASLSLGCKELTNGAGLQTRLFFR